ncbi:MAG: PH domain-containing protein [Bifidobacteriaceae bacterium]|jgi:uncharacterized membrane protein YdbT with pleckstrin-like domain|nr:PH domain-containing protein [Bifidobacteriaceae bacterium]
MPFSKKELAVEEYVVFHARAHWKTLVAPFLVLAAAIAGTLVCYLVLIPERESFNWLRWAVLGLAVLVIAIWFIAPLIRWACRTDTLTNYRLISREGVFKREGRDIPMDRVHAVNYTQTFLERILGAGTLIVQTAAQTGDVNLDDVAKVKRRQLQINEQLLNRDFESVAPDSRSGRAAEAAQGRFQSTATPPPPPPAPTA